MIVVLLRMIVHCLMIIVILMIMIIADPRTHDHDYPHDPPQPLAAPWRVPS